MFLLNRVKGQDAVHLQGFESEPVYPSLSAFVHDHTLHAGALPVTLRLPLRGAYSSSYLAGPSPHLSTGSGSRRYAGGAGEFGEYQLSTIFDAEQPNIPFLLLQPLTCSTWAVWMSSRCRAKRPFAGLWSRSLRKPTIPTRV